MAQAGKSGGDRVTASRLIVGDLPLRLKWLVPPQGGAKRWQKSAEAVVLRALCGGRAKLVGARSSHAKLMDAQSQQNTGRAVSRAAQGGRDFPIGTPGGQERQALMAWSEGRALAQGVIP